MRVFSKLVGLRGQKKQASKFAIDTVHVHFSFGISNSLLHIIVEYDQLGLLLYP